MDTVVRDASAALANAPTPRHHCRCRDLGVIAGLVLAAAPHDDANEHDVSSARAAAPTKRPSR